MSKENFAEQFINHAHAFDAIANRPYEKPVHLAGDVDRVAIVAARTLNGAADAGLLPSYTALRAKLLAPRPAEQFRLIELFKLRSLADWYRRSVHDRSERVGQDDERAEILGLWRAATGSSWLMRDYAEDFEDTDCALDWLHFYPKPDTHPVVEVRRKSDGQWLRASTEVCELLKRLPRSRAELGKALGSGGFDKLRQYLPDDAIVCVESQHDAQDWIARLRALAAHYARACRLLSRLVSDVDAEAAALRVGADGLTVTEAAQLLVNDLVCENLKTARARVSKAASTDEFHTNGKKGPDRRIGRISFDAWRLKQRDKANARDEARC